MSQLRTNSIVPVGGIPAGADGGGIIQVVQTQLTSIVTIAGASFSDITGLSASITPRSTSSKILVCWQVTTNANTQNHTIAFRLMRGATAINVGDAAGSRLRATAASSTVGGGDHPLTHSGTFLDSPATTSSTTYKLQLATESGQTTVVNRNNNADTDGTDPKFSRYASNIILMEVSG